MEALATFGPVAYATCMPHSRMALVEFEDLEGSFFICKNSQILPLGKSTSSLLSSLKVHQQTIYFLEKNSKFVIKNQILSGPRMREFRGNESDHGGWDARTVQLLYVAADRAHRPRVREAQSHPPARRPQRPVQCYCRCELSFFLYSGFL